MPDLYSCYADLAAAETEELHYRIRIIERASPIVIIAPHGGRIEPGTSQTAALIAAEEFSLYLFEGLASGRRLHVTSTRFDEPRALRLIGASEIAIAVHGRADGDDSQTIWMGGLHVVLRDAIGAALARVGFKISTDHHMQGKHIDNICNKGRMRAGVQLELPRSLRNEFAGNVRLRQSFAAAVRAPVFEKIRPA